MNWIKRDKAVIWHPFTAQKGSADPIHIERGEGIWLYSSDGRKFIDAISSWWVNLHGHAHPYIAQKIAEQALQLEHVLFAGCTHASAITLAEELITILPKGSAKIFYSDNGSTAVEVAIKMALQYWYNKRERRTKIIAFEHAYHGDTFGAMSAGARTRFTDAFQSLLFQVIHIPVPDVENLEVCQKLMNAFTRKGDVAAFIYEPLIQGAAGMRMHQAKHLDALLMIAKEHGVICIADEVMTGFGRTGMNFASDYMEEKPDVICLSKGLTGGFMPLGVTACNSRIFEAFDAEDPAKTFYHGHSYTANPLACAAAIASLELLKMPSCQLQIEMISQTHITFSEEIKQHPSVKSVQSCGTILAVELNTDEETSYFHSIRDQIYQHSLEQGVLLRPLGNIIYCMPPFCIQEKELVIIYKTIKSILAIIPQSSVLLKESTTPFTLQ